MHMPKRAGIHCSEVPQLAWIKKLLVVTVVVLLRVPGVGGAVPVAALTQGVDRLCEQTGLRRAGNVEVLRRSPYGDLRYRIEVPLLMEGKKQLYSILLDEEYKMVEFQPEGWPFVPSRLIKYPPGYDTYKNPHIREVALSAVRRFNRVRKYNPVGQPTVQKVGPHLLVTYQWTSRQHRGTATRYRDAVLSFIVTQRGTVCGQLWGTWPTNGKWPQLPLPGSEPERR